MGETIRAFTTGSDTYDWRAVFADNGAYVCDIRLSISSMLTGSRYYVLSDDRGVKEGTFKFQLWDLETIRETVTAILRSMYADANVVVELPSPPSRAAGT